MTGRLPRVLYYAHHHGSGHGRHAERFARLRIAEVAVTGTRAASLRAPRRFPLPPDDADPHVERPESPFHWTPRTPAVRARLRALHDAMDAFDPDVVLVDVSVEAAVFAVLAGRRTILRRMPGDRSDRAHLLAYDAADLLIAYYPESVEDPAFASERRGEVRWLGMPEPPRPLESGGAVVPERIAVIAGTGGDGLDAAELARAARSAPDREWLVMGEVQGEMRDDAAAMPANLRLLGRVESPGRLLRSAGAIIAGGGHNTVADVASARRPAILIPEPRPFREQAAFAERIGEVAGVPVASSWAEASWPSLLAAADASPPDALARTLLVDERRFASRAAEALEAALASGRPAAASGDSA